VFTPARPHGQTVDRASTKPESDSDLLLRLGMSASYHLIHTLPFCREVAEADPCAGHACTHLQGREVSPTPTAPCTLSLVDKPSHTSQKRTCARSCTSPPRLPPIFLRYVFRTTGWTGSCCDLRVSQSWPGEPPPSRSVDSQASLSLASSYGMVCEVGFISQPSRLFPTFLPLLALSFVQCRFCT